MLVALAAFAAQPLLAQPADPVEKPVLAPGDRWTYRIVDLWTERETSRREEAVVELLLDGIRLQRSTFPAGGGAVPKSSFQVFTLAWPISVEPTTSGRYVGLDFPLSVGKSWEMKFSAGSATNVRHEQRTATAEAWETVQVPAGTFNALRVVHKGRRMLDAADGVFGSPTDEILWYSPEVKSYVRREYQYRNFKGALRERFREELVEFTVR